MSKCYTRILVNVIKQKICVLKVARRRCILLYLEHVSAACYEINPQLHSDFGNKQLKGSQRQSTVGTFYW